MSTNNTTPLQNINNSNIITQTPITNNTNNTANTNNIVVTMMTPSSPTPPPAPPASTATAQTLLVKWKNLLAERKAGAPESRLVELLATDIAVDFPYLCRDLHGANFESIFGDGEALFHLLCFSVKYLQVSKNPSDAVTSVENLQLIMLISMMLEPTAHVEERHFASYENYLSHAVQSDLPAVLVKNVKAFFELISSGGLNEEEEAGSPRLLKNRRDVCRKLRGFETLETERNVDEDIEGAGGGGDDDNSEDGDDAVSAENDADDDQVDYNDNINNNNNGESSSSFETNNNNNNINNNDDDPHSLEQRQNNSTPPGHTNLDASNSNFNESYTPNFLAALVANNNNTVMMNTSDGSSIVLLNNNSSSQMEEKVPSNQNSQQQANALFTNKHDHSSPTLDIPNNNNNNIITNQNDENVNNNNNNRQQPSSSASRSRTMQQQQQQQQLSSIALRFVVRNLNSLQSLLSPQACSVHDEVRSVIAGNLISLSNAYSALIRVEHTQIAPPIARQLQQVLNSALSRTSFPSIAANNFFGIDHSLQLLSSAPAYSTSGESSLLPADEVLKAAAENIRRTFASASMEFIRDRAHFVAIAVPQEKDIQKFKKTMMDKLSIFVSAIKTLRAFLSCGLSTRPQPIDVKKIKFPELVEAVSAAVSAAASLAVISDDFAARKKQKELEELQLQKDKEQQLLLQEELRQKALSLLAENGSSAEPGSTLSASSAASFAHHNQHQSSPNNNTQLQQAHSQAGSFSTPAPPVSTSAQVQHKENNSNAPTPASIFFGENVDFLVNALVGLAQTPFCEPDYVALSSTGSINQDDFHPNNSTNNNNNNNSNNTNSNNSTNNSANASSNASPNSGSPTHVALGTGGGMSQFDSASFMSGSNNGTVGGGGSSAVRRVASSGALLHDENGEPILQEQPLFTRGNEFTRRGHSQSFANNNNNNSSNNSNSQAQPFVNITVTEPSTTSEQFLEKEPSSGGFFSKIGKSISKVVDVIKAGTGTGNTNNNNNSNNTAAPNPNSSTYYSSQNPQFSGNHHNQHHQNQHNHDRHHHFDTLNNLLTNHHGQNQPRAEATKSAYLQNQNSIAVTIPGILWALTEVVVNKLGDVSGNTSFAFESHAAVVTNHSVTYFHLQNASEKFANRLFDWLGSLTAGELSWTLRSQLLFYLLDHTNKLSSRLQVSLITSVTLLVESCSNANHFVATMTSERRAAASGAIVNSALSPVLPPHLQAAFSAEAFQPTSGAAANASTINNEIANIVMKLAALLSPTDLWLTYDGASATIMLFNSVIRGLGGDPQLASDLIRAGFQVVLDIVEHYVQHDEDVACFRIDSALSGASTDQETRKRHNATLFALLSEFWSLLLSSPDDGQRAIYCDTQKAVDVFLRCSNSPHGITTSSSARSMLRALASRYPKSNSHLVSFLKSQLNKALTEAEHRQQNNNNNNNNTTNEFLLNNNNHAVSGPNIFSTPAPGLNSMSRRNSMYRIGNNNNNNNNNNNFLTASRRAPSKENATNTAKRDTTNKGDNDNDDDDDGSGSEAENLLATTIRTGLDRDEKSLYMSHPRLASSSSDDSSREGAEDTTTMYDTHHHHHNDGDHDEENDEEYPADDMDEDDDDDDDGENYRDDNNMDFGEDEDDEYYGDDDNPDSPFSSTYRHRHILTVQDDSLSQSVLSVSSVLVDTKDGAANINFFLQEGGLQVIVDIFIFVARFRSPSPDQLSTRLRPVSLLMSILVPHVRFSTEPNSLGTILFGAMKKHKGIEKSVTATQLLIDLITLQLVVDGGDRILKWIERRLDPEEEDLKIARNNNLNVNTYASFNINNNNSKTPKPNMMVRRASSSNMMINNNTNNTNNFRKNSQQNLTHHHAQFIAFHDHDGNNNNNNQDSPLAMKNIIHEVHVMNNNKNNNKQKENNNLSQALLPNRSVGPFLLRDAVEIDGPTQMTLCLLPDIFQELLTWYDAAAAVANPSSPTNMNNNTQNNIPPANSTSIGPNTTNNNSAATTSILPPPTQQMMQQQQQSATMERANSLAMNATVNTATMFGSALVSAAASPTPTALVLPSLQSQSQFGHHLQQQQQHQQLTSLISASPMPSYQNNSHHNNGGTSPPPTALMVPPPLPSHHLPTSQNQNQNQNQNNNNVSNMIGITSHLNHLLQVIVEVTEKFLVIPSSHFALFAARRNLPPQLLPKSIMSDAVIVNHIFKNAISRSVGITRALEAARFSVRSQAMHLIGPSALVSGEVETVFPCRDGWSLSAWWRWSFDARYAHKQLMKENNPDDSPMSIMSAKKNNSKNESKFGVRLFEMSWRAPITGRLCTVTAVAWPHVVQQNHVAPSSTSSNTGNATSNANNNNNESNNNNNNAKSTGGLPTPNGAATSQFPTNNNNNKETESTFAASTSAAASETASTPTRLELTLNFGASDVIKENFILPDSANNWVHIVASRVRSKEQAKLRGPGEFLVLYRDGVQVPAYLPPITSAANDLQQQEKQHDLLQELEKYFDEIVGDKSVNSRVKLDIGMGLGKTNEFDLRTLRFTNLNLIAKPITRAAAIALYSQRFVSPPCTRASLHTSSHRASDLILENVLSEHEVRAATAWARSGVNVTLQNTNAFLNHDTLPPCFETSIDDFIVALHPALALRQVVPRQGDLPESRQWALLNLAGTRRNPKDPFVLKGFFSIPTVNRYEFCHRAISLGGMETLVRWLHESIKDENVEDIIKVLRILSLISLRVDFAKCTDRTLWMQAAKAMSKAHLDRRIVHAILDGCFVDLHSGDYITCEEEQVSKLFMNNNNTRRQRTNSQVGGNYNYNFNCNNNILTSPGHLSPNKSKTNQSAPSYENAAVCNVALVEQGLLQWNITAHKSEFVGEEITRALLQLLSEKNPYCNFNANRLYRSQLMLHLTHGVARYCLSQSTMISCGKVMSSALRCGGDWLNLSVARSLAFVMLTIPHNGDETSLKTRLFTVMPVRGYLETLRNVTLRAFVEALTHFPNDSYITSSTQEKEFFEGNPAQPSLMSPLLAALVQRFPPWLIGFLIGPDSSAETSALALRMLERLLLSPAYRNWCRKEGGIFYTCLATRLPALARSKDILSIVTRLALGAKASAFAQPYDFLAPNVAVNGSWVRNTFGQPIVVREFMPLLWMMLDQLLMFHANSQNNTNQSSLSSSSTPGSPAAAFNNLSSTINNNSNASQPAAFLTSCLKNYFEFASQPMLPSYKRKFNSAIIVIRLMIKWCTKFSIYKTSAEINAKLQQEQQQQNNNNNNNSDDPIPTIRTNSDIEGGDSVPNSAHADATSGHHGGNNEFASPIVRRNSTLLSNNNNELSSSLSQQQIQQNNNNNAPGAKPTSSPLPSAITNNLILTPSESVIIDQMSSTGQDVFTLVPPPPPTPHVQTRLPSTSTLNPNLSRRNSSANLMKASMNHHHHNNNNNANLGATTNNLNSTTSSAIASPSALEIVQRICFLCVQQCSFHPEIVEALLEFSPSGTQPTLDAITRAMFFAAKNLVQHLQPTVSTTTPTDDAKLIGFEEDNLVMPVGPEERELPLADVPQPLHRRHFHMSDVSVQHIQGEDDPLFATTLQLLSKVIDSSLMMLTSGSAAFTTPAPTMGNAIQGAPTTGTTTASPSVINDRLDYTNKNGGAGATLNFSSTRPGSVTVVVHYLLARFRMLGSWAVAPSPPVTCMISLLVQTAINTVYQRLTKLITQRIGSGETEKGPVAQMILPVAMSCLQLARYLAERLTCGMLVPLNPLFNFLTGFIQDLSPLAALVSSSSEFSQMRRRAQAILFDCTLYIASSSYHRYSRLLMSQARDVLAHFGKQIFMTGKTASNFSSEDSSAHAYNPQLQQEYLKRLLPRLFELSFDALADDGNTPPSVRRQTGDIWYALYLGPLGESSPGFQNVIKLIRDNCTNAAKLDFINAFKMFTEDKNLGSDFFMDWLIDNRPYITFGIRAAIQQQQIPGLLRLDICNPRQHALSVYRLSTIIQQEQQHYLADTAAFVNNSGRSNNNNNNMNVPPPKPKQLPTPLPHNAGHALALTATNSLAGPSMILQYNEGSTSQQQNANNNNNNMNLNNTYTAASLSAAMNQSTNASPAIPPLGPNNNNINTVNTTAQPPVQNTIIHKKIKERDAWIERHISAQLEQSTLVDPAVVCLRSNSLTSGGDFVFSDKAFAVYHSAVRGAIPLDVENLTVCYDADTGLIYRAKPNGAAHQLHATPTSATNNNNNNTSAANKQQQNQFDQQQVFAVGTQARIGIPFPALTTYVGGAATPFEARHIHLWPTTASSDDQSGSSANITNNTNINNNYADYDTCPYSPSVTNQQRQYRILSPASRRLAVRLFSDEKAEPLFASNAYVVSGQDYLICVMIVTTNEVILISHCTLTSDGDLQIAPQKEHTAEMEQQRQATNSSLRDMFSKWVMPSKRKQQLESNATHNFSQVFREARARAAMQKQPLAKIWRFNTNWISHARHRYFHHQNCGLEIVLDGGSKWFMVVLDTDFTMSTKLRDECGEVLRHIHSKQNTTATQQLVSQQQQQNALLANKSGYHFHLRRPNYCTHFIPVFDETLMRESRKKMKEMWMKRQLSNFGYLSALNDFASRTSADVTQFPVFPWVITQYNSSTLDLSSSTTYRDLSLPAGALNPNRAEELAARFREWPDPETKPFHHGTHYSTSAIVMYYLVRFQPFLDMHKTYQGGKVDKAERLFHSIAESFTSVMSGRGDVKELIAEWFVNGDIFSPTGVDLGTRQDGTTLGAVVMPPWAGSSPHRFAALQRLALESALVTQHLPDWFDLIFGQKQQGELAEKSLNVFMPSTYESGLLEAMTEFESAADCAVFVAQVQNFGLTPRLFMKQLHPKIPVMAAPSRQQLFLSKIAQNKFAHVPLDSFNLFHNVNDFAIDLRLAGGTATFPAALAGASEGSLIEILPGASSTSSNTSAAQSQTQQTSTAAAAAGPTVSVGGTATATNNNNSNNNNANNSGANSGNNNTTTNNVNNNSSGSTSITSAQTTLCSSIGSHIVIANSRYYVLLGNQAPFSWLVFDGYFGVSVHTFAADAQGNSYEQCLYRFPSTFAYGCGVLTHMCANTSGSIVCLGSATGVIFIYKRDVRDDIFSYQLIQILQPPRPVSNSAAAAPSTTSNNANNNNATSPTSMNNNNNQQQQQQQQIYSDPNNRITMMKFLKDQCLAVVFDKIQLVVWSCTVLRVDFMWEFNPLNHSQKHPKILYDRSPIVAVSSIHTAHYWHRIVVAQERSISSFSPRGILLGKFNLDSVPVVYMTSSLAPSASYASAQQQQQQQVQSASIARNYSVAPSSSSQQLQMLQPSLLQQQRTNTNQYTDPNNNNNNNLPTAASTDFAILSTNAVQGNQQQQQQQAQNQNNNLPSTANNSIAAPSSSSSSTQGSIQAYNVNNNNNNNNNNGTGLSSPPQQQNSLPFYPPNTNNNNMNSETTSNTNNAGGVPTSPSPPIISQQQQQQQNFNNANANNNNNIPLSTASSAVAATPNAIAQVAMTSTAANTPRSNITTMIALSMPTYCSKGEVILCGHADGSLSSWQLELDHGAYNFQRQQEELEKAQELEQQQKQQMLLLQQQQQQLKQQQQQQQQQQENNSLSSTPNVIQSSADFCSPLDPPNNNNINLNQNSGESGATTKINTSNVVVSPTDSNSYNSNNNNGPALSTTFPSSVPPPTTNPNPTTITMTPATANVTVPAPPPPPAKPKPLNVISIIETFRFVSNVGVHVPTNLRALSESATKITALTTNVGIVPIKDFAIAVAFGDRQVQILTASMKE